MARFLRGHELPSFVLNEKYATGSATGYTTAFTIDGLGADGWKPAEQIAAEHLNWLASGAGALYQSRVDAWLQSWTACPGTNIPNAARCANGFTLIPNIASTNLISYVTDVPSAAVLTTAIAPAAGSSAGVYATLALNPGMLVAVRNTTAPTKALWRSSTISTSFTEGPTLTGAVATDVSVDGDVALRRDEDDNAVYFYTATNDKLWRSTDNAASFSAMGAPGRSVNAFSQAQITAARGKLVLADCDVGAGNVYVRIFDATAGTWANTTVTTHGATLPRQPVAVAFSDTLGRWILTCRDGTTCISATVDPASVWTVISTGAGTFGSGNDLFGGWIIDNLILRTYYGGADRTHLRYSTDLGATWRAAAINSSAAAGVGNRLFFDGARLRGNIGGVSYCTSVACGLPTFPLSSFGLPP